MKTSQPKRKAFETGDPLALWQVAPPEWAEHTLWDLATYINGRAFRPTDFSKVGLPVVKITELKYGFSENTACFESAYDQRHLLRKGDVLFAWSGNPETSLDAFWWRDGHALLNQHIFRVIPREGIEKRFLYYLLKFLRPTFVRTARDKATSMGHVKVSDLKRLIARLPSKDEQRAIEQILGTLDDKIELNRRMNEKLEAITRAIFKSWFVDFDPVYAKAEGRQPAALDAATAALFPDAFQDLPLGQIPLGWQANEIRARTKSIQYGLTRSASQEPVGPHFLRITDIQGGRIDWRQVPFCPVSPEEHEKYRICPGDILVARTGASTGENIYILHASDSVFASYLVRLQFADPSVARVVGEYMRTPAYFDHVAGAIGGSAQPNASAQVLASPVFAFPTASLAKRFAQLVDPFDRRRVQNSQQVGTLASLRDALLPKLISGQIRIRNAEKLVEAST